MPRTHRPYYRTRYWHRPYYPYYGWGWGGYAYPPFMSFYGWYPYPFGWHPYPYYAYGPYDNTASVRLRVTPREAEVYVDGYYAGIVDEFDGTFQRLNLLPGSHEITIYLPGYRSATERRYFRPRGGYKITHTLDKLPAGQPDDPKPQPQPQAQSPLRRGGRPDPAGFEPGRRAPEPPFPAGPRGRDGEEFDPGRRPPEPRWPAPGDDPGAVPPGEPRSGPPVARRVAPAAFGSLVIRVQPEGASIEIDGERWSGPEGQDRLVVQLADGRHQVEVRKDGYVPYSTEVDVRAGEQTLLNVSLPPVDRR